MHQETCLAGVMSTYHHLHRNRLKKNNRKQTNPKAKVMLSCDIKPEWEDVHLSQGEISSGKHLSVSVACRNVYVLICKKTRKNKTKHHYTLFYSKCV